MGKEYSFRPDVCYCGLELTDKKAAVSGSLAGGHPTGKCPGCGISLLLDAPQIEPEPEPEPEPEAEPE